MLASRRRRRHDPADLIPTGYGIRSDPPKACPSPDGETPVERSGGMGGGDGEAYPLPPLADEWAQGPPYLCDACPRRHTSLPANVFTGHDASKNMITRVNILGIRRRSANGSSFGLSSRSFPERRGGGRMIRQVTNEKRTIARVNCKHRRITRHDSSHGFIAREIGARSLRYRVAPAANA